MNDKRPVAPEGFAEGQAPTQFVVRDPQRSAGRNTRQRLFMGALWCFLGSVFVPAAPVLSNVLVAFGAAAVLAGGSQRERVMTLLCALLAGSVMTVALFDVEGLPMTITSIAVSFAMAWMMVTGSLRTGWVIAMAVAATGLMLGADMVTTTLQGTSVAELITSVVDQVVEENLASVDLAGTTALLETRDELVAYWPTIYFSVGLALVLCALAGAWLGALTSGVAIKWGMISRYDVPLWVALVFAVGVAMELLGPRLPLRQDEVTKVGANVVMCARIVLAQQGVSVLLWWMRERRVASPLRTLVVLVALWLEMSFALTSIMGLLDVAVNFRRFRRGRPDLLPGPSREH